MAGFEALVAPISGDQPAGSEVRYEPVYDEIKEARRVDAFEDPPKAPDWTAAIKKAEKVLAGQSKDLQIAAWWAESRLGRDGFGGLAEGFRLLRTLVTEFWENAYPELDGSDADFRAAPLNWLGSALVLLVQQTPIFEAGHNYLQYQQSLDTPTKEEADSDAAKAAQREESSLTPEEAESAFVATRKEWFRGLAGDLEQALAELELLGQACDEKFADSDSSDQVPPRFGDTESALQSVQRAVTKLLHQKLELDPDPVDPAAALADSTGGSMGSAPPEPSSGPPTSREDACARVTVAARYLREENPTDPAPYLMLRGLRWGELRAGGNTLDPRQLSAPATAVRTKLKTLLLDGAWAQLLEAGEEVMASPFGRGWLDLQRYILTAIASLGGEYEPVGEAIRGSLRALLQDLPDLAEATLMDDTPTANRETRAWLQDEKLFGAFEEDAEDVAAAPVRRTGSDDTDDVARVLRRARSEAQAGRHERAIRLLQQRSGSESTQRGRFLLRTEAAAVMVEAGHDAVALPILHELYNESSQAQTLTVWEEASVVARPMALLYQCAQRMGDESVSPDALYLEVCRLDPMMALDLPKPGEIQPAGQDDTEDESYDG